VEQPRPRFSVVVPAYQEATTIEASVRSLQAQDFAGLVEIIVVDNNSTDDTAERAAAAGARVMREPERGVCQARQTGTALARGEIVVSTDADTTFAPDWLSRIDAGFAAREDVVAVCGPCRFVDAPWWAAPYTRALFGFVALFYRLTGRVAYATATNIAFRRDAWSGYDLTLTQGGDELGLLRDLRKRGRVHFLPGNTTLTSSRRLYRGFVYSVFVTCFYHYLLTYAVNRIAGRRVLGMAPAIRTDRPHRRRLRVARAVGLAIAALVAARIAVDLA